MTGIGNDGVIVIPSPRLGPLPPVLWALHEGNEEDFKTRLLAYSPVARTAIMLLLIIARDEIIAHLCALEN